MTHQYRQYYDVLGIQPGTTWNDLKKTYRRQIRSWHPDQYPYNTEKKHLAEEHTKLINQAYRELGQYYRRYNALPLSVAHPTSPSDEAPPPSRYRHPSPVSESDTPQAERDAPPSPAAGRRASVGRYAVLLLLGIASGYLILQPVSDPESIPATTPGDTNATPTPTLPTVSPTDKNNGPARLFTIGTSLGEVYSIQGVPTKTEKDIWYYGDSIIYFTQGRVVDWKSTPEHPLHAQTGLMTEGDAAPLLFFSKGSTKTEVRFAQGEPLRRSEQVWQYGSSLVFFENDRVVGWQESPYDSLKVQK